MPKHFGEEVFETVIPRSVRLSEAPSFGKPITECEPGGVGAVAYRALADEFLRRHDLETAPVEETAAASR